jgi:hypothetical protein
MKNLSTTLGKIHSLFESSVNDFCGLELIEVGNWMIFLVMDI